MQVKKYWLRFAALLLLIVITNRSMGQSSVHAQVTDQYENSIDGAEVKAYPSGTSTITDSSGAFTLAVSAADSISISKIGRAHV